MKQLPVDVRDRLARNPTTNQLLNDTDLAEAAEAESLQEDGRQGSPHYLPSEEIREQEKDNNRENGDESAQKEGKGTQIDLEA